MIFRHDPASANELPKMRLHPDIRKAVFDMGIPMARDSYRIFSRCEPDGTGCWMWNRGKSAFGYGSIRCGGQCRPANRVVLAIYTGFDPAGMYACHKCDKPACVNPAHLYWGNAQENLNDAVRRGRHYTIPKRGSANHFAILNEDKVREIRRRVDAGEPHDDLAKEYGVVRTVITRVGNRTRWAHVK